MAKTFYVNLFHNGFLNYTGFKKSLSPDSEGGVRPVMMPINSFRKAVEFPYRLDEDKNIKRFSSGDVEVAFLVPTRDVENLTDSQFERSLYYRLVGEQGSEAEELREKVEDLQDKIGTKKKRIRELEQEEEEKGKGGSQSRGSSSLRCPNCGQSNPRSSWENNRGLCPGCDMTSMDDPEVVRE